MAVVGLQNQIAEAGFRAVQLAIQLAHSRPIAGAFRVGGMQPRDGESIRQILERLRILARRREPARRLARGFDAWENFVARFRQLDRFLVVAEQTVGARLQQQRARAAAIESSLRFTLGRSAARFELLVLVSRLNQVREVTRVIQRALGTLACRPGAAKRW